MDDYTRLVLDKAREARRGERAPTAKPQQPPPPRPSSQKTVEKLDRKMEELRGKIDILDKALADTEIFSKEPKKAADFAKLRTRLAGELEELENQWLEAQLG
jgi:ATP-binding cassette subfamily F protein 3